MPDFKPLYRYSFYEAMQRNEQDQWRESFDENQRCRDFIDEMVRENYDGLHIKGEIPQKTIAEFGFDRTRWVFANHIQHYDYDGRISPQNKVWASDTYIPRPEKRELRDHNTNFLLNSHQTLVDYLASNSPEMRQQIMDNMTEEEKTRLQRFADIMQNIEDEITAQGLLVEPIKAQVIFLCTLIDREETDTLYADFVSCFADNADNETVFQNLTDTFGVSLTAEEKDEILLLCEKAIESVTEDR